MVEFRNRPNVQTRPMSFHGRPAGINNVRFRACSVKDSVYDDKFRNVRYHTVAVPSEEGRPYFSDGEAETPTGEGGRNGNDDASLNGGGSGRREEGRAPPPSSFSSTFSARAASGVGSGGVGSGGGATNGVGGANCSRPDVPRNPPTFGRESSPPTADAADIKRIRASSDLYEILGVTSAADEARLKRAYRKLALGLHPDKNDAEGSAEAFKSVSNAFAILSDADKRRKYDNWSQAKKWERKNNKNNDAASNAAASRREAWVKRGTGRDAAGGKSSPKDDSSDDGDDAAKFHSDISAEELFNMFFGTGSGKRAEENVHVHRAQHTADGDSWSSGGSLFLHLLPVLLLLILSTTSNIFAGESPYSLKPSQKFPVVRTTKKLEIPYYVKSDFKKQYKKSRIPEIEEEIEDDFVSGLKGKCEKEQKKRDIDEGSNRKSADRKSRHNHNHIHDHKTPSCELLRRVTLAGYYVNS